MRDHARVQPGQKVLVNGGAGGVGTFAVQIAKAFGAEVTAVCSTANVEQARSLGADHVVDYTREDFTRLDERFDVLLDIAGTRSLAACRRVLNRDAVVVVIGAPMSTGLGPLKHIGATRVRAIGHSQKVVTFIAKTTTEELTAIGELIEKGKVEDGDRPALRARRGRRRAALPRHAARTRQDRHHDLTAPSGGLATVSMCWLNCQQRTCP